MNNKLLIIGPFSPPITGVSVANELLYKELHKYLWEVDKINTEFSGLISSAHGTINLNKFEIIKSYFIGIKIIKAKIIYITIGQTFYGVLKYAPFIFLAKLLNKKVLIHLHGNHLLNEYNSLIGLKKQLFSHIINRADNAIVLSSSLRNNFEPFIASNKIFNLFNFYEDNIYISEEEFLKKKFTKVNLLFLSNFMEEKGINVLLEAIKKIKNKGLSINIKIAGNKTEDNNIDMYLKELPFVEYCGVVKDDKKKELLLWANVFCLPTFYKMEGQPISIIEAMATGNLILTTKHAGIPDICTEENAIFCKKNNVEDLTDKILFLINNINFIQTIATHNYKQASIKFTQDNFIKDADKILKQCLN
ncbi:glycosyltransferase family 4 protein [Flavobacterium sp.]|jgi:glycosyltransferase involved in cell wall biosynthesis|uniref:glycosyltransferase family 4 protein n=1 Tax=Flavobacterium sp. TaxID=239 RepID=UPI0037BE6BF2